MLYVHCLHCLSVVVLESSPGLETSTSWFGLGLGLVFEMTWTWTRTLDLLVKIKHLTSLLICIDVHFTALNIIIIFDWDACFQVNIFVTSMLPCPNYACE